MKKFLYLFLFLFSTGCFKDTQCSSKEFRQYTYMTDVKVVNGFYKGQTGKIVSGVWVYDGDCNIPAFLVRLDLNGEDVKINQYDLYVESF